MGSLLGLGGGIIVVPALTLLLGVNIHYAIGASLVGVIATSSASASRYVRNGLTNMRLGMLLEVSTVSGALVGAFLAGILPPRALQILFGVLMAVATISLLRTESDPGEISPPPPDRLADRLKLHGSYHDGALGQEIPYRVGRTWLGLIISALAGIFSGLLGVGGGFLKVPAMHVGMKIPLKVASATSSFMIGVTAAASAGVFFSRGLLDPSITAPVATGVLLGAALGARLLERIHGAWVRNMLLLALAFVAVQMVLKGVRG